MKILKQRLIKLTDNVLVNIIDYYNNDLNTKIEIKELNKLNAIDKELIKQVKKDYRPFLNKTFVIIQ